MWQIFGCITWINDVGPIFCAVDEYMIKIVGSVNPDSQVGEKTCTSSLSSVGGCWLFPSRVLFILVFEQQHFLYVTVDFLLADPYTHRNQSSS